MISINKAQSHDLIIDKSITLRDEVGKKMSEADQKVYFKNLTRYI